jgi:hypothetical protein
LGAATAVLNKELKPSWAIAPGNVTKRPWRYGNAGLRMAVVKKVRFAGVCRGGVSHVGSC